MQSLNAELQKYVVRILTHVLRQPYEAVRSQNRFSNRRSGGLVCDHLNRVDTSLLTNISLQKDSLAVKRLLRH